MEKLTEAKLKVISQAMTENEEWTPIWRSAPEEKLADNVTGIIIVNPFTTKSGVVINFKSLSVKVGKTSLPFNLASGTDADSDTFSIGRFIAAKDHTPNSGNEIIAGESYRHFAYSE